MRDNSAQREISMIKEVSLEEKHTEHDWIAKLKAQFNEARPSIFVLSVLFT